MDVGRNVVVDGSLGLHGGSHGLVGPANDLNVVIVRVGHGRVFLVLLRPIRFLCHLDVVVICVYCVAVASDAYPCLSALYLELKHLGDRRGRIHRPAHQLLRVTGIIELQAEVPLLPHDVVSDPKYEIRLV